MATKLLLIGLFLFALLIIISALGERTLPLFGGDRQLAARVHKTGFALIGSTGFSLSMPAVFGWFGRRVSSAMKPKGWADFVTLIQQAGYWAMGAFLIVALVIAAVIWMQDSGP